MITVSKIKKKNEIMNGLSAKDGMRTLEFLIQSSVTGRDKYHSKRILPEKFLLKIIQIGDKRGKLDKRNFES